jgi:type IV secretory pathway VirB6-like protein
MHTHRDNPARNQRSRASWVTDLHPNHKEILENMKKLVTLLFAAALTLSLSSAAFAQDTSSTAPADKKEAKAEKKAAKKEKKAAKKEKKAEKKDEMKKDEPK